jgi:hypothetical protein
MCTMDADLTSGQRLMAESIHMGVEVKVAADKLDRLEAENAKLRDLIFDILVDEERGHNDDDTYYEHVRLANGLGIEVRSRWSALTGTRGARTTATR